MYIQYSIYVVCVCMYVWVCIGLALRISYCCNGNVMPKRGHHGKKIYSNKRMLVSRNLSRSQATSKQILRHNTTPTSQYETYPSVRLNAVWSIISYQSCMLIHCLHWGGLMKISVLNSSVWRLLVLCTGSVSCMHNKHFKLENQLCSNVTVVVLH